MKKAGMLGMIALAVVLVPLLSGFAAAQTQLQQTVQWTPANVTATSMVGWTGYEPCGNSGRNTGYGNSTLTCAWTDTLNATSGRVRIQLTTNWSYMYPGVVFNVAVNSVSQGTWTPTYNQYTCPSAGTSTVTWEAGLTAFTGLGSNNFTLTPTTTVYCGLSGSSAYYCQIVVTKLNTPPNAPQSLIQIGPDNKTIPVGGLITGNFMEVRATVTDPDADNCYLELEFQPTLVFFTGNPNFSGLTAASGQEATVSLTGLVDGSYHWQVRSVDPFNERSAWTPYGGNSEVLADVVVNASLPPPKPIDPRNHSAGDCNISVGPAVGLLSPSIFAALLLAFGLGRRRR